jgi:hypothetical protein
MVAEPGCSRVWGAVAEKLASDEQASRACAARRSRAARRSKTPPVEEEAVPIDCDDGSGSGWAICVVGSGIMGGCAVNCAGGGDDACELADDEVEEIER